VGLESSQLGESLRLSEADSGTADLVYLELKENWFQLGIPDQMNLRLSWSNHAFNQLWLWQECHAHDDWPWWGRSHIVGVEPHTSAPAAELSDHIEKGRHLTLAAKASADAQFLFELTPGNEMGRKDRP